MTNTKLLVETLPEEQTSISLLTLGLMSRRRPSWNKTFEVNETAPAAQDPSGFTTYLKDNLFISLYWWYIPTLTEGTCFMQDFDCVVFSYWMWDSTVKEWFPANHREKNPPHTKLVFTFKAGCQQLQAGPKKPHKHWMKSVCTELWIFVIT